MHRIMEFKFVCVILALLQVLLHCAGAATCVKQDSCSCKFDDGSGVISLKTLDTKSAGTPRFTANLDDYDYGYTPCSNFSWSAPCTKVALCQRSTDGKDIFDIGNVNSSTFAVDGATITYSAADSSGTLRTSNIKLICNPSATNPEFIARQNVQDTYNFELTSNCACKNGCVGGGISLGSVLCIIFSVVVILYLLVGVLFLKFVRGAEGKELIPNYEFWKDLPLLIKDGVLFLAGGCKSDSNYEQI